MIGSGGRLKEPNVTRYDGSWQFTFTHLRMTDFVPLREGWAEQSPTP